MRLRHIDATDWEVRAILEGRKTQNRRTNGFEDVLNYPGILIGEGAMGQLGYKGLCPGDYYLKPYYKKQFKKEPGVFHWFYGEHPEKHEINPIIVKCPYGQPGDRFWVREAWKINSFGEEPMEFQYKADGAILEENSEFTGTIKYDCWYERACWNAELYLKKLDYAIDEDCGMYVWENGQSPLPWQSSIFMPRWASRIMLEIVSVRVQRIQDISEEDSIAEGIYSAVVVGGAIGMTKKFAAPGVVATDAYGEHDDLRCLTAKEAYRELWNSVNSKRGYSWEKNPWVWALEYRVVTR